MRATFPRKQKQVEYPVVFRYLPFIRLSQEGEAFIMQDIKYRTPEGIKRMTVVLEKVKRENLKTRFRACCTRTSNAIRTCQLGVIKQEVAS